MKPLVTFFFLYFSFFIFSQESEKITFDVDPVHQIDVPLPTTEFNVIAQNKLRKIIFAMPEEHRTRQIAPTRLNGFVESIHVAFDEHRPLTLSPDDVWLTICQAFGNHIAVIADEKNDLLIAEEAPKEIRVFVRDLAQNNTTGWEKLVNGFNDSLKLHIKHDAVSLVNQKFSTTTAPIATAYQITLMDAVKSYFSFVGESGCGIPHITLLGTPEDWQKIYDALDGFNSYGLEFWTKELKPVIKEFVNASKGNVNISFWQTMYKHESFYGVTSVTGWVHKFFPYLKTAENLEEDVWDREVEFKATYRRNPYIAGTDYLLSTVSTFDFPKGYVKVPFTWVEHIPERGESIEHSLELNAGFLGMIQDQEYGLQPFISWCITEADKLPLSQLNWDWENRLDTTITENCFYWMPGIVDTADQMPVFNPDKNTSYSEGIQDFTEQLKIAGFDSKDASTVELISCSDGSTVLRSISGPLKKKEAALLKYISLMEERWLPAQVYLHPMGTGRTQAPANYKVELKL